MRDAALGRLAALVEDLADIIGALSVQGFRSVSNATADRPSFVETPARRAYRAIRHHVSARSRPERRRFIAGQTGSGQWMFWVPERGCGACRFDAWEVGTVKVTMRTLVRHGLSRTGLPEGWCAALKQARRTGSRTGTASPISCVLHRPSSHSLGPLLRRRSTRRPPEPDVRQHWLYENASRRSWGTRPFAARCPV
jgi:hypothetical protein